jgi:hypothetical protein
MVGARGRKFSAAGLLSCARDNCCCWSVTSAGFASSLLPETATLSATGQTGGIVHSLRRSNRVSDRNDRGGNGACAQVVFAVLELVAWRDVAADDLEEASGDANRINNFVDDDFVLHGGEKLRRDILIGPFEGSQPSNKALE